MFLKYMYVVVSGIFVVSCTTLNNNLEVKDAHNIQSMVVSTEGKIFTYDFDPLRPQVDMGITGTLVEKDGCLLIQPPVGTTLITPVLPDGVTRWDKKENNLYIENRKFVVGQKFSVNGVFLDGSDKSEKSREYFKSQAELSCLKDILAQIGTHRGESW
jgi:hypothetical protein